MKKQQVKIGGVYSAKITDKVVPVRIDAENRNGGWDATNLQTNRKVRIKSAQKLRGPAKAPSAASANRDDSDAAKVAKAIKDGNLADGIEVPTRRAKKKLTAAERKALLAKHKADQDNARVRDERASSADGMTASERAMTESAAAAKRGKKKAKAAPKEKPPVKPKKLSLIDAAVQVLAEADEPMNCKQIVEQVTAKKLWSSDAATPWATLYSAILRETQNKGDDARFTKVERGRFTLSTIGKKGA